MMVGWLKKGKFKILPACRCWNTFCYKIWNGHFWMMSCSISLSIVWSTSDKATCPVKIAQQTKPYTLLLHKAGTINGWLFYNFSEMPLGWVLKLWSLQLPKGNNNHILSLFGSCVWQARWSVGSAGHQLFYYFPALLQLLSQYSA